VRVGQRRHKASRGWRQRAPRLHAYLSPPAERDVLDGPKLLDRAELASDGFVIFAGGGILGLVLLALPHDPRPSELGIALCAVASIVAGVGLLLAWRRIPPVGFQAITAAGIALISLGIYFQGSATRPIVILYAAVAWVIFYYFTPRQTALQMLWLVACYGLVLELRNTPAEAVQGLVALAGVVSATGILVHRKRRRLEGRDFLLMKYVLYDNLTGLHSRIGFERHLEPELSRLDATLDTAALAIVDVDRFKEVNDKQGHLAGDRVLCDFARLIRDKRRAIDITGRFGGDEFALLMPVVDAIAARHALEALRDAVAAHFGSDPVAVTASIGFAIFPEDGRTADELLAAADKALYTAKLYRNCVAGFDGAKPCTDGGRATVVSDAEGHGSLHWAQLSLDGLPLGDELPSPNGETAARDRRRWRGRARMDT
jgi:diguanylate cyclase (GGDEF)-like protein